MKQVMIKAFCDGDHEERVEAVTERVISIDGSKPILLDVCEDDDKLFDTMLRFMERGAVAESEAKPKKSKEPKKSMDRPSRQRGSGLVTTCPDCGFTSKTRSALGQHTRVHHKKGLKDYPSLAAESSEPAA